MLGVVQGQLKTYILEINGGHTLLELRDLAFELGILERQLSLLRKGISSVRKRTLQYQTTQKLQNCRGRGAGSRQSQRTLLDRQGPELLPLLLSPPSAGLLLAGGVALKLLLLPLLPSAVMLLPGA